MKKLILSAALLSGTLIFAQETPKKDSVKTSEIKEVSITKKVFQKKADRMIYDVAASPATKGNTAFDLLKETPTVTTSDDKEFKILGKSDVVVYINGRKSNMNAEALLSMLKSTVSENISRIEVISVPGSEFDVPGNTGIINIVMKKKTTDGYNGTLKMATAIDKFVNPSSSASLNFRKNKIGGTIGGGYSEYKKFQGLRLENGSAEKKNISKGQMTNPGNDIDLNLGLDYDINDKNYLGWTLNSNANNSIRSTQEYLNESFEKNLLLSQSTMRTVGNDRSRSVSTALNYDHSLDKAGSKIKLNAAYLYFKKDQEDLSRNYDFGGTLPVSGFNQYTPQNIHNISAQADFIKKFKDESTFSAGGNFSNTKTDNDAYFEQGDGYSFAKNSNLSNHFVYSENIGAIYANYERNFGKKLSAKGGIRYEITAVKGDILDKPDPIYHFTKNYGNILPFANLNYAINENNALSYSFSSRVHRPSFWELNPARTYTTPTNYIQNNPFVLPAKIYSHELQYMYKNAYFLTLGATQMNDASTQIPLQKTNAKGEVELRYLRTNYGSQDSYSATLGMQKSFFKGRWNAGYSVTGVYTKFQGSVDTDPLTGEKFDAYIVDRKTNFIMLNANNQIGLDQQKTWWLGVDYFYLTSQKIELGTLPNLQSLNL